MKYVYILIALAFMGCSDKAQHVEKVVEQKAQFEAIPAQVEKKIEMLETATVVEPVMVVLPEVKEVITRKVVKEEVSSAVLVNEPKVVKPIGSDIPSSCAMWSDGCNVCTRIGKGKASCDTGPKCQHKMFSCLQWQ